MSDNQFWCMGCKRVVPMRDEYSIWVCDAGHVEFAVYRDCPDKLNSVERIIRLVMTPTRMKTIYSRGE